MSIAFDTVAYDVRERRALASFEPALAQALLRGRPAHVADLQTSLTAKELVALGVRLAHAENANVAVLPTPSNRGVIFVPV